MPHSSEPLSPPQLDNHHLSDPAPPDPASPQGQAERVLVVDDEPSVGRVACRALERLGYQSVYEGCPQAALALLSQSPFDLLLTDYSMPGMNGLKLIQEARRLRPDLPVLLMSGYASAAGAEKEAPGIPLLTKPFSVSALGQAISLACAPKPA